MNTNINTTENGTLTPSTSEKNKGKIIDKVWQVFKGLIIAAIILAVVFDTYVAIGYFTNQQAPVVLEYSYPYNTQDFKDLTEARMENPNGEEYKKMLKAFNTKYSISYKTSGTYEELARLYKENPDSEEYKQTLAKLLEEFDISAEDIIFDE